MKHPENINSGRITVAIYGIYGFGKGTTYRLPMISYFLKNSYKTLLDVSCGCSGTSKYYRWKGFDVTTTEYDDELIKNSIDLGFPCSKVDLNNKKLPFKDNSFDVVTISEVLEHLKYPKEIVEEAYRVAKYVVIITTPVGKSYIADDHLHFWYSGKELEENLLSDINGVKYITSFVTVPQDFERVARSFIITLYKDEVKE